MNRTIGSTCLVAGTSIGAGMMALPIVLAKLGLAVSCLLMALVWAVMYFTALAAIELNLQAGHGLTLAQLGRRFSGKTAEIIGLASIGLLCYALLAAYLYGGASITRTLLLHLSSGGSSGGSELIPTGLPGGSELFQLPIICTTLAIVLAAILTLKVKHVDFINRVLFLKLIAVLGFVLVALICQLDLTPLPLSEPQMFAADAWAAALPVLFTSFGFQVVFHTLTNYLAGNQTALKQAFFWGSLIPALVYVLWTIGALGILYQHNPKFYAGMRQNGVDVGEFIEQLGAAMRLPALQLMAWVISVLAIVTSAIGVGLGLLDMWKAMIPGRPLLAIVLTLLPAYAAAMLIPNAFIQALSFAGMVLVVIAVFMPLYLLGRVRKNGAALTYPILRHRVLSWGGVAFGIVIIASELLNWF